MKKQKNKQGIKASKWARAENKLKKQAEQIIMVKNAEGDPDTQAKILIQNKISYTPKVSVIIPVYNVEAYLRECLDSVINQTLKEIEIICVDDGSTDNSLEILKEYAKKDNRISVLTQKNQGAAKARNDGLKLAKGAYLSILDSDDFFDIQMLEKLYNKAIINSLDITVCRSQKKDEQSKLISLMDYSIKTRYLPEKDIFNYKDISKYIFNIFVGWSWDKLYNRKFVRDNKLEFQSLRSTNDMLFVFLSLVLAEKISIIDDVLITHRQNRPNQLSGTREKDPFCFIEAIYALKENLIRIGKYEKLEQSFINWTVEFCCWQVNTLKPEIRPMVIEKLDTEVFNKLGIVSKSKAYFYNAYAFDFMNKYFSNKISNQYLSQETSNGKPKVSILVPIYNVKQYLAECIDSIIAQTLKDIEIILLDDGSTDGCSEICDSYAAKDSRIKVIHKPNSGYGSTMNIGLDAAEGKYIGIVESDDYIRPEMYEEQYQLAEEKQLDFLKADFRIFIGENSQRTFTYRSMSNYKSYYNKILKPLDNINIFNTNNVIWSGIYNREFLNKNKIRFNETPGASFQDNGFYFQTYCLANRMWIMNKDYYQLRRDNPNSSVKSRTKVFVICEEYKFIENFLNQHPTIKKKAWGIFLLKKYHNYIWTYERAADDLKLEFLKQFALEFKNELKKGNISDNIFKQSEIDKIKKIIKNPSKYYQGTNSEKYNYKRELQTWYQRVTGKYLNLDNPRTFNEKIQWLKLYDSTPIKTRLADKYLVRDWVKEQIGEQYLIPLLGVYDKFEDIDFDKLPNQFVIKCNHGSGWNIIVKDKSKLDLSETKEKLDRWMSSNFAFKWGYELHYKNMKPKIIIEKYMENTGSQNLYDYKFWCFNGNVKYMQFRDDFSANLKMVFYDLDWKKQPFYYDHPLYDKELEKPNNFSEMISIAQKLCQGFAFVCVDLYRLNDGTIYFGEMTFTRSSGGAHWNDDKYNRYLGDLIKLPKVAYNIDTGEYYKLPKRSKIKPYLLLPYNLCQKTYLRCQEKKINEKYIQKQLSSLRIDIKNFGKENNAVEITASAKISQPIWFANAQGIGQVVETNKKTEKLSIKAIQDGKLRLDFKGQDKRFEGIRFPVWIDYKSIKIDGKEILSAPIATWHDKPFRYEMAVKDGQIVKVDLVQQYHQYSKDELKDVILKLNSNSDYIKENIEKLTHKIYQKITLKKTTIKVSGNTPQTTLFAKVKQNFQKYVNLWHDKFSFVRKIEPVMDLMQKNQAQTLKLLQEIQAKYASLENKNNELKKEVEVLKGTFNTQLSDFKKQQEERSKQLMATGDRLSVELQHATAELQRAEQSQASEIKAILSEFTDQLAVTEKKLSAELQRATEELQNSGISEISEIKTYCADFAHQLGNTEVKLLNELNNQRETALQNKNNIMAGINQTEQSLQIQVTKSQELVQEQQTTLNRVQESLEDLSTLKEIDFAQKSEINVLSRDIEKQKSQLLEKVQNLQNKAQLQYQELNFADLLHDSTQKSPWLKDKNFALYGWAANYSFIYTLFRILDNVQPAHILEMGLGQTSIVTSQYIANNKPEADLDIIENDESWIKIYEPKLAKSQNIKLHQCDIEFFNYEGEQSRKYKELDKIAGDKKYNLIIVDGPFGGAQKLPRSNIVELVEHNLAQDFIIIFDDAERAGEQNTIALTKAKLTSLGIEFGFQQRNALKSQVLIFSKSCEFAKYL